MMMATLGPPASFSFLPLLESLEDESVGQSEHTDAYLTIANRLSGEEGRQFLPSVEKHFPRFGKAILAHVTSPNAELSQAALQALGFCVYHSHVVSGVPDAPLGEILSVLCSLVVKSTEKNTRTRALWVISKQSFPSSVVAKNASLILTTLESVWSKEDVQSVVTEHEALNVVIRMLEQVPTEMGDEVMRWAKLVIPLVVHSASKVRLRAAAAMELGMPLLLKKQLAVAGVIEPLMSTKLIPELQKLYMSKNETNVLKLWALFVKLLGKLLHKAGPFINSLLHLEELGFRSSSPTIKKIAFIAWKSLIDNFALNPDILCSAKRIKLLLQPLTSINVKTEALMLTKVEVWWYLVIQIGPNLSSHFDQVAVPLLQCTIRSNSSAPFCTPARSTGQNGTSSPATPGTPGFTSPFNTSRMNLNSSMQGSAFPSIQLLGLEMILHYLLGPEVVATAMKKKLLLSLEPLNAPLVSSASTFTKHAAVLISNIKDGIINTGRDAPEPLLTLLWSHLLHFVNLTIEAGSKKDRQGSEVLTLTLLALQSIVNLEALSADKVLALFEITVKGISQRVLGSASYQVGKMDVLNGTPALYLIQLLYSSSMLATYIEDTRFYVCLQTLVACGLSGHTSPLAFAEAVLSTISRNSGSVQNKEQLCRMWSTIVGPLTETVSQSNEVNQGDALEHNFSAMYTGLMFPVSRLLPGTPLQQASQKSMLSAWAKMYKVFARCSALVVTAEENICCEELCAKMAPSLDKDTFMDPLKLNCIASIFQVMVECVDFSPYTPQFQQKLKSPHTPMNWARKRNKTLRNLSTFLMLLVQCLDVHLENADLSTDGSSMALVSILSTLFSNLVLADVVKEVLSSSMTHLTTFYQLAAVEPSKFSSLTQAKLEKLLSEIFSCLQSRSTLAFDTELLALLSPLLCVLFPHKNKQLRTSTTQFWNSSFANSVSLTYPDELRPVLSQVKQKTPIILPGFEVVSVPDDLSEPYSSESSQMETKLSGINVSVGKRDSLLGTTSKLTDSNTPKKPKPVSTKLDFSSPKPPRQEFLEEEASTDFVFIPPETKERVLTEHQKEVKRTKRVDIPAMYNNLDASLDTTVFTQYTQSQDDSTSKLPTEPADKEVTESSGKVPDEGSVPQEAPVETDMKVQTKDAPEASKALDDGTKQERSSDVSMDEVEKSDSPAEETNMQAENTSPNVSGSSDVVSGTPPRSGSSSRRQSFITLEKYSGGKPSIPEASSKFVVSLVKLSCSNEQMETLKSRSQEKRSPESESNTSPPANDIFESPRRPKLRGEKTKPVCLMDRLPSDPTDDEEVIPDTQTGVKESENINTEENSSSSERESQTTDYDSLDEPRRSSRRRIKPLLPGEDPQERESKYTVKKKGLEGSRRSESLTTPESRPNTRGKAAAEEESAGIQLRSRSRDKNEASPPSSQGSVRRRKMKLYSNSDDFLPQTDVRKHRSKVLQSSQNDLQTDTQSDSDSPSQGLRRKSKVRSKQQSRNDGDLMEKESDLNKPEPADQNKAEKTDSQHQTASPPSDVREQTKEGSKDKDHESPPAIVESRRSVAEAGNAASSQTESIREDSEPQSDPQVAPSPESQVAGQTRKRKSLSTKAEPSPGTPNLTVSLRRGRSLSSLSADSTEGSPGGSQSSQSSVLSDGRRKRGRPKKESVSSVTQSTQDAKLHTRRTRASLSTRSHESTDECSEQNSQDSLVLETSDTPDLEGFPNQQESKAFAPDLVSNAEEQGKEDLETEVGDRGQDQEETGPSDSASPQTKRQKLQTSATETEVTESEEHCGDPDSNTNMVPEVLDELPCEPSDDMVAPFAAQAAEGQEVSATSVEETGTAVEEDPHPDVEEPLAKDPPSPTPEQEGDASELKTALTFEDVEERKDKPSEHDQAEENTEASNTVTEVNALTASASDTLAAAESTDQNDLQTSPAKPMELQLSSAVDVVQSPSSSRTKGTWSPSASPSTSILKKGMKRPYEEESPSPLVKSRRVSFANPIQQQETADDIDRRSPALRTSSPRRSKLSSLPQPKFVTTPTKGLLVFSPRVLHSPSHKSSKKCLISEMGQEPRPVSKDCIYPPLVGCPAPVEAVLPQISYNMWARGFGQLMRARNVKTVGDLSALTPAEVKALPVRSPKVSNVKRALRIYEQQRKSCGVEVLKSFDETEMMTSELEDLSAPVQDEDDKASVETLATALEDDPVPDAESAEPDPQVLEAPKEEAQPEEQADGLQSDVDKLCSRMTPPELGLCSPQQLVAMHDQLGDMMRRVVVELQTRLCPAADKH
ncbi:telomere-associated protein RIF1 [Synchiropus picturatus]